MDWASWQNDGGGAGGVQSFALLQALWLALRWRIVAKNEKRGEEAGCKVESKIRNVGESDTRERERSSG
jgi:hypothetical protein